MRYLYSQNNSISIKNSSDKIKKTKILRNNKFIIGYDGDCNLVENITIFSYKLYNNKAHITHKRL